MCGVIIKDLLMGIAMENKRKLSFIICFIMALFPFYSYMQMDMINVMAPNFIQLGFNPNQISLLFSGYLYTVALFLLPAGIMLDHYREDTVMYIALILMIIGALLFSISHSFEPMFISRIISAIGHSFSIASCLKITARVVRPRDYGIATGGIMTIILFGSLLAQTPLAYLIAKTNMQIALVLVSLLGVIIILSIKTILNRYNLVSPSSIKNSNQKSSTLLQNAKMVLFTRENLLCTLYMCSITCPTAWLSELWGVTYLVDTNHINVLHASLVTSMLYLGTILGSPICGYISDWLQNRKSPMMIGALVSLIATVIIFNYQLSLSALMLCFFLIGFFASTYSLGYSVAMENNQKETVSMASGLINVMIVVGVSSFLNAYSALTPTRSSHLINNYALAFWLLSGSFIVSFIVAIFLRENIQRQNTYKSDAVLEIKV